MTTEKQLDNYVAVHALISGIICSAISIGTFILTGNPLITLASLAVSFYVCYRHLKSYLMDAYEP